MSLANKLTSEVRTRFELKQVRSSFFSTVLRGKFRGMVLEVGIGWLAGVYLRCEVELPLGIFRRPPGTAPGLGERLREVHFGDPVLDTRLRIRTENPDAAVKVFGAPEVKSPLLGFFADFPEANLRGATLEISGLRPKEVSDVHDVLDRVLAFGTALSKRAWAVREEQLHAGRGGTSPSTGTPGTGAS